VPDTPALSGNPKPIVVNVPGFLFLHFGEGNFQSLMRKSRPHRLELGYTRTMMGFLLFNPQPRHIVMIGLGGGSVPKHCYRHMRDVRISVVEINPEVIALREQFHIPPDSERFSIICGDGAEYVAAQKDAPDVLVVDGFGVLGQVPQLCSQQFYEDCHAALRGNGVLVVNVLGADTALDTYLDRLRQIFGAPIAVVPSEDCNNKILFAVKGGGIALPEDELMARVDKLEAHHRLKFRRIAEHVLGRSAV
jgi:spermidine synthase